MTVYQAPNSGPGFIDAFFAAASQNTAGSISTSWGESETYVASADPGQLYNEATGLGVPNLAKFAADLTR
ncbi:MAG TPA: hypothetical protein VFQ68_00140 [Streptosporangiaceae bacterium]|nr:hypothetical protein [Streptosporangiaceae bacterium]